MNFYRSIVSFFEKTAVVVALLFCGVSAFAAPLVIVTEPGAEAVFKANGEATSLGVADADGLLLIGDAPAVSGTLVLSHADASAPVEFAFDSAKNPGKISVPLKLRAASLLVSAFPADEVEIFVNGKHCGRGAVALGDVEPHKAITIEARSARRGMQSRVVSAKPGEALTIKFDLRGNDVAERPDGQIVLPEIPLVLASQTGATVKADGALVALDADGVLRGLEPGARVIEIFLPWKEHAVCVWRASLPARSALLPGADVVAVPVPAPAPEAVAAPATSAPAETTAEKPAAAAVVPGRVLYSIGSRVTVSLGVNDGLKAGATASVVFGANAPVSVNVLSASAGQALLQLPEGAGVPADDTPCNLVSK